MDDKELDKDESEMDNKNIYMIASTFSVFIFIGIMLLGLEIVKNQQKASIIFTENNELEKKFQYNLLDNEDPKLISKELREIQEI